MINIDDNLYGPDATRLITVIQPLVADIFRTSSRYTFMSEDAFAQLCERDFKAAMKVYWEEMLARAHIAGTTSIVRSYRWLQGMNSAHAAGLFLPFCASFRALLESAADTYHALNGVALTLAENHKVIEQALAGDCNMICIAAELENILIHFAYAHKPTKGIEVPSTHVAKTMADYLKPLKNSPSGDIKELYSELCQYTHPAAHSVHYMLGQKDEETLLFLGDIDKERVERYVNDRQDYFSYLFMLAFNTPVLVLKVLHHFDISKFHVRFLDSIDLAGIPAWQQIERHLSKVD